LYPNLVAFGGSGVVTDAITKSASYLISGKVKETSIYSIADLKARVPESQSYSLPATVPAKLYNSETIDVPVKWNPAFADTSSVGSRIYEGVVDGYGQTVKLHLEVITEPISQYTTYFDSTLVNRTQNILLAAEALNGKILAPGERFSFNESVGKRTAEAGYKEAPIISEGAFIPAIGGGVCQVSSTLFNAVILAHLEILERHHHSLPINYVPPGQDATVSYPSLDFKFRNTLDAYLQIRSFAEGDALTFQLYSK
ncbi:MAG TPA: VanW family protein, partial [Desulfitobacteriaceae bacterium]|nr:VanW family protein [Desulfitobacteriaceae bacterium]